MNLVKHYRRKDPHRQREASKYEHPVPSREFILQYMNKIVRPVSFRHLLEAFNLKSEEEKEGIRRRLRAMERDGQLIRNRRGSYALVKKMELISGRVEGHRDGFGFVIPDEGGDDIFISARHMRCVFHDDRVLVRVSGNDYRGRAEGLIVEVLEHNTHQVVGRFYEEGGIAFVDPDKKEITQDIIIPMEERANAKHGQIVVVEITKQPSQRRQPMGKVIEILGDHLASGMEVELAIRSHELPFVWPVAVLNEAKKLKKEISEQDIFDRKDLRDLPFVTIDGEDAKDFDDAVYCERKKGQGWTLYVAIADVSHYVRVESNLDEEAKLRGNSVYFPARVIPMLPEHLSNNLCSLKPQVDRLVMVCEMSINAGGKVTHSQFHNAVIKSRARLTYNQVASMLDDEKITHPKLLPHLKEFHRLFKNLYQQRVSRGAIEFETTETKIVFSKQGKINRIVPVTRNVAHRMIEEAMLLANVSAANKLFHAKIPTLYRVHEGPEQQKLLALRDYLKAFGLRLAGGKQPTSKDYANLLRRISNRPDAHILQTMMLRSLRQAIYSPENLGHFGLAYERYLHFTSPIRRYPDLMVHRALKYLLKGGEPKKFQTDEKKLHALGMHCSMTDRRSDEAAREAIDWLKCEYMMDKVGKEFEGIISGVTSFGVFLELKDIYVEGLIHITSLKNDYYHYDDRLHLLRGKRSGKIYRLGESLRVLVSRVDLDARQIDFELTE